MGESMDHDMGGSRNASSNHSLLAHHTHTSLDCNSFTMSLQLTSSHSIVRQISTAPIPTAAEPTSPRVCRGSDHSGLKVDHSIPFDMHGRVSCISGQDCTQLMHCLSIPKSFNAQVGGHLKGRLENTECVTGLIECTAYVKVIVKPNPQSSYPVQHPVLFSRNVVVVNLELRPRTRNLPTSTKLPQGVSISQCRTCYIVKSPHVGHNALCGHELASCLVSRRGANTQAMHGEVEKPRCASQRSNHIGDEYTPLLSYRA